MAVPSPVLVPTPVAMPKEMVLTVEDAAGAELLEMGDVADPGDLALYVEERKPVVGPVDIAASLSDESSLCVNLSETLQKAAVEALLGAKNQDTAADALDDAQWVVVENEVRVQTEISKTMLPMVVNAEAEKLIKGALRDAGAAR